MPDDDELLLDDELLDDMAYPFGDRNDSPHKHTHSSAQRIPTPRVLIPVGWVVEASVYCATLPTCIAFTVFIGGD